MKFSIGSIGFLFASTLLVNAGNYMINLVLGRFLGPELFAEASVIATIVLMLSFFAVGIQLTSAKFSATYAADENLRAIHSFNKWITNKVLIVSLSISAIIISCSLYIQKFLHFDSIWPIIIIGIGIPFYFDMSVKRGIAQGTDRIQTLAWTYIMEMLLRLVFTFVFVYIALRVLGYGTSIGISIAFVISFMGAFWVKRDYKAEDSLPQFEASDQVKHFVGFILIYEFSQILINNSDVILAKHFFEATEAGKYAAIALIGRVVFFGTWTIVTLLFPKVIQREKQGLPHLPLFWFSFGITAVFGLLIIMACVFFPELIISVLFGSAYLDVANLLWKYAIATTLFAGANVFAYYYMSLNKYLPSKRNKNLKRSLLSQINYLKVQNFFQ